MNINAITGINNFSKSKIKFGESLSEQLGLNAQVRHSVDTYMPEIKSEIKELVKNEMRATKSGISDELDSKIDAYDKFSRIRNTIQLARRSGNTRDLGDIIESILCENRINLSSQAAHLEKLRTNQYARNTYIRDIS